MRIIIGTAAMFLLHGMMTILLLLIGIGAGSQADGLEMVTNVNVTASMYDTRTYLEEDEYKGCYDTGCLPSYVLDGLLNDRPQSRWSCSEELDLTIGGCYMTFDLHDSFTLGELIIYFLKSNDTSREIKLFDISTSADNVTYEFSFSGNSTLGTPLGTGENFSFPNEPSGRYVRLDAIMDSDEWLSINEVEIYYVDIGSPSPATIGTPVPTPVDVASSAPSTRGVSVPSPTSTASPAELGNPSVSASLMSSMAPTPAPTSSPIEGGLECANVTVSYTEDLDGLYVWDSGNTFSFTDTKNATIESSQISIDCADTTFTGCFMTKWTIKDEQNPLLAYMAFDDAENPALITQVWLRENCSNADCNSSPANVEVVCGDSSTFGASVPTPTPVSVTSTECEIVEVEGTSGGNLDGVYYDDGSPSQGGVTQFIGYEDDLTSNGNTLAAEWVTGGCPSPSGNTTIINGDCTWRKWSITPDSGNFEAFEHFTYDEADHPVDIASGILWYTSDTIEKPYDGGINITCAPADTPALMTPSPSPAPTNTLTPTAVPSISPSILTSVTNNDDDRGGMDYTPVIIAGVAGAAVLLTLAGCLAHRRFSKPIPLNLPSRPPPYNNFFSSAKH